MTPKQIELVAELKKAVALNDWQHCPVALFTAPKLITGLILALEEEREIQTLRADWQEAEVASLRACGDYEEAANGHDKASVEYLTELDNLMEELGSKVKAAKALYDAAVQRRTT